MSAARVADGEDGAPETPAVAASTTENEEVSQPEPFCIWISTEACSADAVIREGANAGQCSPQDLQ